MKDKTSFFIRGFTQSATLTFFSRISGFIRDIFIAAFLGAGIFSDIFLIAFKLPNLFRRITAEGALTSACLPIYTKLIEQKGKSFADTFLKVFIFRTAFFLFLLTIILQIIMPFCIYFLAPGFLDNSLVLDQITTLTRITIIFMPLISIVALLGVATNVSGKFWILSFSPIILNLCLIISCFFISDNWTVKSLPLALATVVGGILQLIFTLIMIKKFGILKLSFKSKNIKEYSQIKLYLKRTWKKFLPAAFGGGILQVNLLVDTVLASLLGFGSVSYLYFADRIAQLPLGIIGIALSTALLTSLSRSSAIKDTKQFSKELIISLKIGLFFSIPASFVFINFSELFIKVLFERGEFSSLETNQTAQALIAYAFGIPAFIIIKSCQPAFLADGNTKTPMYIGFILLLLNVFLSYTLMHYLKHSGIALATSLVSWTGSIMYIVLLIKKGKISKFKFTFKYDQFNLFVVLIYALKIIFTSCLMVLIMKPIFYILNLIKINEISILLFLVLFGMLTFFSITYFLKYIPQELLKINVFKFRKVN